MKTRPTLTESSCTLVGGEEKRSLAGYFGGKREIEAELFLTGPSSLFAEGESLKLSKQGLLFSNTSNKAQ